MHPTRLNLLSPAKQSFLQKLVLAQYTKHVLEVNVVVLSIGGIILLLGQSLLDTHFNNLIKNIASFSNQQASKNRIIIDINKSVSRVQILQKEYMFWTPILAGITQALPDGITITAMEFNKNRNNAIFTGLARSREDLLTLKANILSLPSVSDVNIPLSQLAEKDNIPISFNVFFK